MKCLVYALVSTKDETKVRYIGQTTRSLKIRLAEHKAARHHLKPVSCWILKHMNEGYKIKIIPLCIGTWDETEIDLIANAKLQGIKLLNVTIGGKGEQQFGNKAKCPIRKRTQKHKGLFELSIALAQTPASAKLSAAEVSVIKSILRDNTATQREIGLRFNVHECTISDISHGRSWKAVP